MTLAKKNLIMNAHDVDLNFSWKWYLKDLPQPDKPVKVFSTFSCGGGSSMGYKRAGFEVIGNVEIDKAINAMYVKNHKPKYNFNMDIRDFNELDNLPDELFTLDILDGSPPCTTFSSSGLRESSWGIEKKFREGQKKQRLDDLFFVFLDTVSRLKPKVVIAENVMGLLTGNAKGYVYEIIKVFHDLGYAVQLFHLNAATMEVPQVRNRIFFIANNQEYSRLRLDFAYPYILFGNVRTQYGKDFVKENTEAQRLLEIARETDRDLSEVKKRLGQKRSRFNHEIVSDKRICPCVTSSGEFYRLYDRLCFSDGDFVNVQTFPQDYDFCGCKVQYVCGMSVPPNMTAHIAIEIWRQWLYEYRD